jgi:hypothetical protein
MTKFYLSSVALISFLLGGAVRAQPIKTPYVFVQSGSDTVSSPVFAQLSVPTAQARVYSDNGHFFVGLPDKKPQRIRFFGTELEWTAQFLSSSDAHVLAKRLHKLGFNAVRLVDNDYHYWNAASFFDNVNQTTSYNVNPDQVAKFDTLLYELKQQGIYSFLVLNSVHYYFPGDGVAQWDTIHSYGEMVHFIDNRAAELHRNWAKTFLSHVNPLTGLRLADDPAIAAVEVSSPGLSLLAGWQYGYLNWIDTNNVLTKGGAYTIGWNRSRRLDTLFSQYLLHKYGSDGAINSVWKGSAVINPPNVIGDGSFEQVGSPAWSFNLANGATGAQSIFSPGIDSQYCDLLILSAISSAPNWYDAYLQNTTARLAQDSLYELTFYAKIHYDPAKPVLSRSVLVYLAEYQTGAASLSMYQTIDTGWKKYTFDFRTVAGGLQTMYLGIGQQMGDVMLDAVSIKRMPEYGLFAGESSAASSIVRIKFGESDLLPRQRVRDLALFYDSLQTEYFSGMRKCITDTIKSPVLINCYATDYWSTLQDVYANRSSDFTQAHINSDYPFGRPGGPPYSDSTWVMQNNSMLRDAGNYYVGDLASGSIGGKPFIGRYMNLVTNQQSCAQIPFLTSYASLQDWDGIFFDTYAAYSTDLFSNIQSQDDWWGYAGFPSYLVQMPQASDAFRNMKVQASSASDTITHVADDIWLESVPNHYSGPFGVEASYLDPNIATQDLVREKFDVTTHKVAAEYPYIADTSMKVSATGELRWSQSDGYFLANSNGFNAAAGIFGADTVIAGNLRFRRLDDGGDVQSILLTQLTPATALLTASTRAQNSREVWQYHDSSIGQHWGEGPTIMSAGTFEFFLNSDSNKVIAHFLDTTGNFMGAGIEGVRISGTKTFKIAVDQSLTNTPWYFIESSGSTASVAANIPAASDVTVIPNPAQTQAQVRLSLSTSGKIRISLFDDLGREVSIVADGELSQGSHELPLDVRLLAAGHYTLRVDCDGNAMSRNVNVVK